MSRKHYEAIAAALALTRPIDRREYPQSSDDPLRFMRNQWLATRAALMVVLEADNPRFDREQFIEATEA